MATRPALRHIWSVEMLGLDPGDRVLEIGCGSGVAVSLVSEQLETGHILAIDRSEPMIRRARSRNASHIESGKATIERAELSTLDLAASSFDKVFASSVSVFLRDPSSELEIIRSALKPGGRLYLFHQPPVADQSPGIARRLASVLRKNGYEVLSEHAKELHPAPVVCVIAQPGELPGTDN